MPGVEQGSHKGEQVASVDGQLLVEGDQAYPRHAQQGGGDVVPVGPGLHHRPGEEGDDDAVHRRQKGIFGGGGPSQAEGLNGVGQEQEAANHRPPPEVVRGEGPPALPGDQPQQRRPGGEPNGKQEKHRHRVQGVLHDEKGRAPDQGGGQQHGLGQKTHGFRGHWHQLQIENLALGWYDGDGPAL